MSEANVTLKINNDSVDEAMIVVRARERLREARQELAEMLGKRRELEVRMTRLESRLRKAKRRERWAEMERKEAEADLAKILGMPGTQEVRLP